MDDETRIRKLPGMTHREWIALTLLAAPNPSKTRARISATLGRSSTVSRATRKQTKQIRKQGAKARSKR